MLTLEETVLEGGILDLVMSRSCLMIHSCSESCLSVQILGEHPKTTKDLDTNEVHVEGSLGYTCLWKWYSA